MSDSGSRAIRNAPPEWRRVAIALSELAQAQTAQADADPLKMLAAHDRDTHAAQVLARAAMLDLQEAGLMPRINAMNPRKEFFRVSLDQVEAALAEIAPAASFFRDVEAQEFRETMAVRAASLGEFQKASTAEEFPDAI